MSDQITSADDSGSLDRRAALKKAALATGVVAWTTPVVQLVSSGTAHAQSVTGCSPIVTITLQATGATCRCAPSVSVDCCSNNTYVVGSVSVDCGPTCAGRAEVAGVIEFPGLDKPLDCLDEVYVFPCSGGITTPFAVRVPVRCPDGGIYAFDGTVNAVCEPCLLEDPPLAQNGVLDDEAVTATTDAWTGD